MLISLASYKSLYELPCPYKGFGTFEPHRNWDLRNFRSSRFPKSLSTIDAPSHFHNQIRLTLRYISLKDRPNFRYRLLLKPHPRALKKLTLQQKKMSKVFYYQYLQHTPLIEFYCLVTQ